MRKDVFCGYEGRRGIGVRNHVLLLPTVACSARTAMRIGNSVAGCKVASHSYGCAQVGLDLDTTYRSLRNTAINPNVASVLIVSLGCERIPFNKLADEIVDVGKRVELVAIQNCGGTLKAIQKGIALARELVKEAAELKKKTFSLDELKVAVECGGSDWTSGVSSNPAVGHAMDKLLLNKATVVFSETPELIGAEHILLRRIKTEKVKNKLLIAITEVEERCRKIGVTLRETNPSPGNVRGGISTLEEKSIGAIYKAGTHELVDVLRYAEALPRKQGLYFMNTPGHDVESVTAMVAGGAQVVVFTTGLGTPTGNPIAPVVKITGNPDTYRRMQNNIDFNAGAIIEGKETIEEVGDKIYRKIVRVASGEKTKSEILGQDDFSIFKPFPSF